MSLGMKLARKSQGMTMSFVVTSYVFNLTWPNLKVIYTKSIIHFPNSHYKNRENDYVPKSSPDFYGLIGLNHYFIKHGFGWIRTQYFQNLDAKSRQAEFWIVSQFKILD